MLDAKEGANRGRNRSDVESANEGFIDRSVEGGGGGARRRTGSREEVANDVVLSGGVLDLRSKFLNFASPSSYTGAVRVVSGEEPLQ